MIENYGFPRIKQAHIQTNLRLFNAKDYQVQERIRFFHIILENREKQNTARKLAEYSVSLELCGIAEKDGEVPMPSMPDYASQWKYEGNPKDLFKNYLKNLEQKAKTSGSE